ncbi:hypothetical protein DPMN_154221 [Dreissena polymorpha]|uniref:Uncharacterized protein n=1 Tax=Dreissena polymorpha TaxID=45954 RepID=A0A9D4JA55_DREPO|nr:hypothetical protein DPMN_154221 [Dreissena polymorpha]
MLQRTQEGGFTTAKPVKRKEKEDDDADDDDDDLTKQEPNPYDMCVLTYMIFM